MDFSNLIIQYFRNFILNNKNAIFISLFINNFYKIFQLFECINRF